MEEIKWFFKSKFIIRNHRGEPMGWRSETLRYRHLSPTIRGKRAIKAAKRLRVKVMKEQQAGK